MRKRAFIICVLPLIFLVAPSLCAQTKAQRNKKATLEKEIAILDKQIKEANKQSKNALSTLSLTRSKISKRKALVAESDHQIAVLDSQIVAQNDTLSALEAKLASLSGHYDELVKVAYRNRDARTWYMYILSSENLGQGLRRYSYLRGLSKQMNAQAKEISGVKDSLEARKKIVEGLRSEATGVRESRISEIETLQKEEGESAALVDKLKKDKSEYQRQLKAKQKQMESLNREIQRMIAEAQRAAEKAAREEAARKAKEEAAKKAAEQKASASKGTGAKTAEATKPTKPKESTKPGTSTATAKKTAADVKLESEFASNKGKLPWPAEGPVVEGFGQHNHPVYTNVKMPFNNGVNIALSPGTSVKSVFDGVVKQVIVMPGYNQCILVQHGGYFTFYCKLGSVAVKAGDKVKTGQTLGKVDTIQGETQLHFELWEGKSARNPELWLR